MPLPLGNVFTGIGFCVPLAGRPVPPDWAFAFKSIGPPINFNMMHMSTVKMKVDAARNKSAEWALENKLKYLFFMGDDTVPPAHILRRFVFLMENNPEIEVLGGIYFTKEEHPMPLVFRGNGAGPYWDWKVGELFAVSGIGMDACLIRTSLFSKLKKPWFKTINADTYAEDIPKVECWTEDLYFCHQIEKQLDRKWNKRPAIFADASIICDHWDVQAMKKYSLPWNSKPATRMFAHGKKKILDLGCGLTKQVFKDGIPIRVDIRDEAEPDYRCDLRALPFKDEYADVVHCQAEGSPILTKQGFQKIEDVKIGDLVWTHNQRWRRVTANNKFKPQRVLYNIVTAGNPQGILVTNEHPVYGKIYDSKYDFTGEIYADAMTKPSSFIEARIIDRKFLSIAPLPTSIDRINEIDLATVLQSTDVIEDYTEVMAGHSCDSEKQWRQDGDKTLAEKYGRTTTQIRGWIYHDKKPFGYYAKDDDVIFHSTAKVDVVVPRFVDIDGDIMRLIGYYLSDGMMCVNTAHLEFYFGIDEYEYASDVARIILEKFGVSPRCLDKPEGRNIWQVQYSRQPLHDIIVGLIGKGGALDKAIPAWALWIEPKLQKELLRGAWRGDGTKWGKGKSISTVSWKLAEGLRLLLWRCGEMASMSKYEYDPSTREFGGCGSIYSVTWTHQREKQKGGMIANDHLMTRVYANNLIRESDLPVYGLEVEDDQSYFASGIIHHNSAQTLEHFDRKEVVDVLDEWLRVLKYKGELRLEVPNLEYTAKEILKSGGLSEAGMDILYGQQKYAEDFHKCGFTPALLKHVLQAKGMKVKKIWSNTAWTICVEAIKMKRREGIGDGEGSIISKESVDESLALNQKFVKALATVDDKPKPKPKANKKARK